jgi:hypothetical protein
LARDQAIQVEAIRIAVNGATTAAMKATVDADLAAVSSRVTPSFVLYNLGVNDMGDLSNKALWQTNTAYIFDAFHAKWPASKVYAAHVWKQGFDAQAATLVGWLDELKTGREAWLFDGHDERVWLKGSDDGATMSYDGIHYSNPPGAEECASQWQTALGY